jgi:hypothetical protein
VPAKTKQMKIAERGVLGCMALAPIPPISCTVKGGRTFIGLFWSAWPDSLKVDKLKDEVLRLKGTMSNGPCTRSATAIDLPAPALRLIIFRESGGYLPPMDGHFPEPPLFKEPTARFIFS